ncbi:MAG: ABC transporter substrate-binding protein [Brevefilum sp.]
MTMKVNNIRITIILILFSLVLIGCTGNLVEEQTPPVIEDGLETLEEVAQVEEGLDEGDLGAGEEQIEARFTIKADAAVQDALGALYGVYFHGEKPLFVDENPDLEVTKPAPLDARQPILQATFLPDAVLVPKSDSQEIANFIEFATSPDGQQVLIDVGALPSVILLRDQAGNQIELPQPVRRVISAYGPATAIVYSVNSGDQLVSASYLGARDPQGAAAMERIDPRFQDLIGDDFFSQSEFNVEQAAMLAPDLIIAGARSAWVNTIEPLGIPVFLMEAETPEQLRESVLLIGKLFGPHANAQAQAWVAYYNRVIEAVEDQLGALPTADKPRVLFTGTQPLRVASGEMYQTDLIEFAGGISVSTELGGYWNDINLEQVAIWDPEVIIVPPYGGASVEAITESAEWQILNAVQQEQVFRMPKLVVPWDTPAPDSVLGIIWLAERLNPDLIELSCAEESAYFYNTFYNYAITGDEIAAICVIE